MKRISTIIQWIFSILFVVIALGNGMHYSTALILISAILFMPIKPIRRLLAKNKIKTWLILLVATVVFFIGMSFSPLSETTDNSESQSSRESITTLNDDLSEKDDTNDINDADATGRDTTDTENVDKNNTGNIDTSDTENSDEDDPQQEGASGIGTNPAVAVNPATLPSYQGRPYVAVNGNIPSFSSAELTTVAYETYSALDSLGRCGVALASCGKEIMPADGEERGSISSIYPSGWVQKEYNCVSGKWLYNRSHLIGWQLSAENANRKNLITGTKYLNVEGMLPFENMIADYIKETDNHVAYRVTPIFEGNNLLCSGVQLEAYSIEDEGDGICFNVYCYNVQPGVVLNYATGESALEGSESNGNSNTQQPEEPEQTTPTTPSQSSGTKYILNKSTKKFHYPSCSSANSISEKNKQEYVGSREDLIAQGYDPCGRCDP